MGCPVPEYLPDAAPMAVANKVMTYFTPTCLCVGLVLVSPFPALELRISSNTEEVDHCPIKAEAQFKVCSDAVNDTGVVVLFLQYISTFDTKGLVEL